ncbi:MAG: TrkA family potassium uptake protein [Erysipelotrichaceae bacterium]|nr:TrkA family potassium uptake protein [Erysipelotrichaceae bacterium]
MKIVIVEGNHEADYIIDMYKSSKNDLIVINSDIETCQYLSAKNDIPVIHGHPTKEDDLVSAGVNGADLFITLSEDDMDNYVACKTAKELCGVKRCIAMVINPKNVRNFKELGIDSVLCSTYILGQRIKDEAKTKETISSVTMENNEVVMLEIIITADKELCGKSLSETNISDIASISCVYRHHKAIIPNGMTVISDQDKLFVVTTKENEEKVVEIFQRTK